MNKKGYAMIMDAVLALTFMLVVFSALYGATYTKKSEISMTSFKKLHYISEDILDVMNKQGILDQIGEEWSKNTSGTNATDLANQHLEVLIPPNMGYRLTIIDGSDTYLIVENTSRTSEFKSLAKTHSSRLLVGYGAGLPLRGHVSRAYLANIREKTTSNSVFFGGFVGQGNITAYLRDIPDDATILQAYVELNVGSDFDLIVNGLDTGCCTLSGTGNMSANVKEYVSNPENYFTTGDNLLRVIFTEANLSRQYIGGGFIKVVYNTSELDTFPLTKTERFWFPGIEGLINYYSSFYVPGTLLAMNATINYYSNYSNFLVIGDTVIFNRSGNESNQSVTLTDAYFQSLLNYGDLSEKTTPVRFGTGNVTTMQMQGTADVVLITDRSGSMDRCVNNNDACSSGCPGSDCRWNLTIDLDKKFVSLVMNSTNNRIGLVTYSSMGVNRHNLSDNETSLNDTIDGFPAPSGGTCLCCAIREARLMLASQSNDTRDKYMIVMTDGIANLRCDQTDVNRTDCCTDTASCNAPKCGNDLAWDATCSDYLDDTAGENAVNDSCDAYDDENAIVHSIGLGSGAIGCQYAIDSLRNISECGHGNYSASDDPAALEQIYADFAKAILNVSQAPQVAILENLTESYLYESFVDNSLEYTYIPTNISGYGEISLTFNTEPFNNTDDCTGIMSIPAGVRVVDAKVTSYSSEHWTDYSEVGIHNVYRLWEDFASLDYPSLGDPFIVQIPVSYITSGENNTLFVETGDSQYNRTGCSADNSAIYTLKIPSIVGYGHVFMKNVGCNWTIEFEDASTMGAVVPSNYGGNESCYFTNSTTSYNEDDALADAVYRLLDQLDLDDNGRVDVLFDQDMIGFELGRAGGVQSLWGPVRFILALWI